MKLLVYMRDGRTCYAFKGRGELAQLVSRGIWNPIMGEYAWTPGIRVRWIAKGSIAVVEEGVPE